MLNVCSPTWLTQPPTTWPTSCGVDARSARSPPRCTSAEQVGRVHGREAAVAAAERRAHRFDDDDVGVGERGHGSSRCRARWPARELGAGAARSYRSHSRRPSGRVGQSTDAGGSAACVEHWRWPAFCSTVALAALRRATATSDATARRRPAASTADVVDHDDDDAARVPARRRRRLPRAERAAPSEPQYLTDVATTSDGCVDTITFTFRPSAAPAPATRSSTPTVRSRTAPGETVTRGGAAFLKVRFEPAWIADLSQRVRAADVHRPAHDHADRHARRCRGLALFDASEGWSSWVVGLDAQRPFTRRRASRRPASRHDRGSRRQRRRG